MSRQVSLQQKNIQNSRKKLTITPLILMTAALFMTLINMPAMAETGLQMIFFNVITVFAFLIPIALVSAELATGWPQNGVFHWVEAAFGTRVGFVAVWLQWVQSLFGMASILAYISGTIVYVFNPSLGSNNVFISFTIISVYWVATFINSRGTARSGMISSVALSLGVLLPTALLILGGIFYALEGNPIEMNLSMNATNWLPSWNSTTTWLLFLNFVFGFVGIEVSANHANEVENPSRNYPIALFVAAVLGFILTLLGAMAIGFIIPKGEIDTVNGAIQSFAMLFKVYHLVWLTPILAFLIALGAAGQVSTWVVGPIKGIWAAGRSGHLPETLLHANRYNVPMKLLYLQASLITLLGLMFLFVKNVESLFLIFIAIAVILYCLMYLLMFIAAIRLRYTHPDVKRAYRIPGGNWGMWLVSISGCLCALTCLIVGFLPPLILPVANLTIYYGLLGGCVALCISMPLLMSRQNSN